MNELEEQLRSVLADPKAMEELSSLAGELMGGGGAPALPEGAAKALSRGHPVAAALGPYLREDRRRRLERALSIASAARLAGRTLAQWGGTDHGI